MEKPRWMKLLEKRFNIQSIIYALLRPKKNFLSFTKVKKKMSELHKIAFNHVVDEKESMNQIGLLLAAKVNINVLNCRNKTCLDEANAMLIMRGENTRSKFIEFLKSNGAVEGNQFKK